MVSENIIIQAEELSPPEDKAVFTYALESGKIFKEQDLTPVYIIDKESMMIYVTSEERIKKKFN